MKILILCALLAGCSERGTDWNNAAKEHTCTEQQMTKAQNAGGKRSDD